MNRELRHWEYSFLMHTRNFGDKVRKGTNPFTGDKFEVPIDDGLTLPEKDAVTNVFAVYGFQGPEPNFEGYALYLPDDQSVRIRGGDLRGKDPITEFVVEIIVRELNDDILKAILEIAQAGNLALMSSVGGDIRLVDRPDDKKALERWPEAKPIQTTTELQTWIVDVIGGREIF
ncbi:MAG: hypothetical protein JXM70_21935 [Pirellulales bacterium]|nr:hypothetical protein [Pirellulales bacterium]